MCVSIPARPSLLAIRLRHGRAARIGALLCVGVTLSCAESPPQAPRTASDPSAPVTPPGRALPTLPPASAASIEAGEDVIFDHALAANWQDWGWGPHDLSGPTARINFGGYGGWILHHDSRQASFGALSFRIRAPRAFGAFLEIRLANGQGDESFPMIASGSERATPSADGWQEVSLPWSQLNPNGAAFDRIVLHAKLPVAADWVEFERVRLTRPEAASVAVAPASVNAPQREAKAVIDCRAADHAISPYIYGVAGEVGELGATARRWGGNPKSRYNWQLGDAHNVGSDWFFENVKSDDYRQFLQDNLAQHVASALTLPMIGWVAKDQVSSGFPRAQFGPQKAEDQYRTGSGNGVRADGTAIRPGAPTQTSVEAPPEFIKKWVEAIRRQDQSGPRSVQLYFLDNEPNLWNSTHRDVHPDPLSYDELLDRTERYGAAIRAADPQALIAGPAEWGWTGYLYSARDALMGIALRPDRRNHGDLPLIPWYLKKLREYRQKTGTRVLDVLDVHYYPQASGVYGPNADPQTNALRLRSTRSLWDPTYKDESWINDTVKLIPRLKAWIAENDPGLKLSIGEYNFGGEQDMSGALALAEALGRFGTEGVDYAYYWLSPPKNSPAFWAFRAFRNFDGKGGMFLDRSLVSRSEGGVSLFASRDSAGKHLVLIALNLDPQSAARTAIELRGCGPVASQRSFSYAAGMPGISERHASPSSASSPASETLSPYSINVFDIVLK